MGVTSGGGNVCLVIAQGIRYLCMMGLEEVTQDAGKLVGRREHYLPLLCRVSADITALFLLYFLCWTFVDPKCFGYLSQSFTSCIVEAWDKEMISPLKPLLVGV